MGESQALKEAFDKNPSDWTQIAQGFDRTPGACRPLPHVTATAR